MKTMELTKWTQQATPHLRPFFRERAGRIEEVAGEPWWLDGLVPLQGRISQDWGRMYREPTRWVMVWERRGLPIGRRFREASWLQGTAWEDAVDGRVGHLEWRYADGHVERVALVYGRTTGKFWVEGHDAAGDGMPARPVWTHRESASDVGVDRTLRLFRQAWTNPRPEIVVETLDFVSARESPASPFLVSLKLVP